LELSLMAEHGGYRRPDNPAPVSGPGRLSRRTDGGPQQNVAQLPNARYGEGAEFEALQAAAPMSATGLTQPAPAGGGMDIGALLGGGPGVAPPVPLTGQSERPMEPLTAGAPIGPGPGPSAVVRAPVNRLSDMLERMLENDLTGEIGEMYQNALRRGL
jgi:hypothetical protein